MTQRTHSDRLYVRLAPQIIAAASRRARRDGLTLSAYVRRLITRDVGIPDTDADAARGVGSVGEEKR